MCWKSIKKTFTSYETIVTKTVRKVNEENYTYDVSSMEEKSKFMECAGRV